MCLFIYNKHNKPNKYHFGNKEEGLLCAKYFKIQHKSPVYPPRRRKKRTSNLFDPLNEGILVKSDGLGTLVQVLLVADAELQNLSCIQPLQTQAARRCLATQDSCGGQKRKGDVDGCVYFRVYGSLRIFAASVLVSRSSRRQL